MIHINFSIVIPYFNNKKEDIERCLESIHNQNYQAYETIIVDDGSEPGNAQFLDLLPDKYRSLKIFHKKHGGVSSARNLGVKIAEGDYIVFVDADDCITSFYLQNANQILRQESFDVLYGLVHYIHHPAEINEFLENDAETQGEVQSISEELKEKLYCHMFDFSFKEFWVKKSYVNRGVVAKVIKKDLAVQIPFDESLSLGEDAVWNLALLQKTTRAVFVKKVWYLYIHNPFSASQVINAQYVEECTKLLTKLHGFVKNENSLKSFIRKIWELIHVLAKRYYLQEGISGILFGSKNREFNKMMREYPWSMATDLSDIQEMNVKLVLKCILIRMNLFLIIYKLKNSM